MFCVDIDIESGVNTVHRADCVHVVPDNSGKQVGELGESGGYFRFPTVGKTVRYLKTERISGIIQYCPYCKPTIKLNMEPAASLGVEVAPAGCESLSLDSPIMQKVNKTVDVTDSKTIWKRLSERLFGSR